MEIVIVLTLREFLLGLHCTMQAKYIVTCQVHSKNSININCHGDDNLYSEGENFIIFIRTFIYSVKGK